MNEELKLKLLALGLSEEQVEKLAAEGVVVSDDMALLAKEDIKSVTGCGLVTAAKVVKAFAPVVAVPVVPAPVAAEPVVPTRADPHAEIPEGKAPSADEVKGFATSMGIDPSMLTMLMFSGMAGNAGMGDMDISGMIPVPQIVAGYNPKVRNMFLMIMGSLERRLGVPIVVINGDGSVNRELTVEYINGLEEGHDAAENNIYYDSDSTPFEVIKVGVDAQSIYDADPLDSCKALQKNGMGIGRVNWMGVSLEVRQVAHLAVIKTREIDPTNDAHTAWLRDHVTKSSNRLTLQGMAPKAIGEYNNALRTGSLPTLRVMLVRSPRRQEVMPRRRAKYDSDRAGLGRGVDEENL